jgi:hypothetical protein
MPIAITVRKNGSLGFSAEVASPLSAALDAPAS